MPTLLQTSLARLPLALLVLLFASVYAPARALAQYHDLDPDLARAARQYDQAQIQADRAALDRLVAGDYLILRGNGSLGDKKVLLDAVAGEGMHNDPFTIERPFQRSYGDTVILGGWVKLTGTDHGKPFTQTARFADTWARRGGRWQVVFTSVVASDAP